MSATAPCSTASATSRFINASSSSFAGRVSVAFAACRRVLWPICATTFRLTPLPSSASAQPSKSLHAYRTALPSTTCTGAIS